MAHRALDVAGPLLLLSLFYFKMVGIYKITNPNNRIYIGQSWNIESRLYSYKNGRCKNQRKLLNSIKKYGWENHKFEVIHELPVDIDQNILNEYEIIYYNFYKDCEVGFLNLRDPGGSKGKLSEETKKILSDINKGKKLSKLTIEKRSKSWKDNYYSLTEDQKKQRHCFKTGKDAIRSIKVDQYTKEGEYIKTWDSIYSVELELGIWHSHISAVCKQKRKSTGGFVFRYSTKK